MKTKNNRTRFLWILPVVMLVISCGHNQRNSDSVTEFLHDNKRMVHGLHFYPSTVRMLGNMMGDEYGKSFKDIRSGRLLYTWNQDQFDLSSHFVDIIASSENEGFEMLAEMNTSDGKNSIYINDRGTPVYLLFLESDFGDYLVELTGDISLQTIYELSTLDYSSVTGNFPSVSSSETDVEPRQDELIE